MLRALSKCSLPASLGDRVRTKQARPPARHLPTESFGESERPSVFINYCYITSYHELNGLKQHTFSILYFLRIMGMGMGSLDPQQGCMQSKGQPELGPQLRLKWGRIHFQVHSGFWPNSFPCRGRTEGPGFLLATLSSLPQGRPNIVAYFFKASRRDRVSKTSLLEAPG